MRSIDLPEYDRTEFARRYGPWAVIAGASEGSGASYAEHLAAAGVNVVLVSRRPDAIEALGQRLAQEHGVEYRALPVDLTQEAAGARMVEGTADLDVGLYISNAGTDGSGNSFLGEPVQRSQDLLTMNARTLVAAVHGFGNRFKSRGGGGIIIMTSGSGLGGQPWLAMYSATKGFEINLAESLWVELQPDHVDVLGVLAPGMDTPALRRALEGKNFDLSGLYDPSDVVHVALATLSKDPLIIFPDGPDAEKIPEVQADRRRRLLTMAEWAKSYTD